MSARYVVAGAALPRAAWFPLVSQWANAGAVPVEFVKCVGLGELVDRIEGSRPFSAILVDAGIPGLDRDLLARARERGAATIVVRDPRNATDWRALGADAVLDPDFDRAALLDALATTAAVVRRFEPATLAPTSDRSVSPVRAVAIAVVGAGGTGTSTVAMALAEAFGRHAAFRGSTLLADCCLTAELAMLHDTRRVAPGLQELVDLHRTSNPASELVRDICFQVDGRGYDLLVGIRRRRLWNTIRPEACVRAIDSLVSAYSAVILDTDADVEGEDESGSMDVEERNVLARTAIRSADHVVPVGQASLKGLHGLTRVIGDLRLYGIEDEHIHPVLNLAPSRARARAGYTAALAELCTRPDRSAASDGAINPPRFVPFRNVDECIRAVSPLPAGVVDPFTDLVEMLSPVTERPRTNRTWSRVVPGSLARAGAGA